MPQSVDYDSSLLGLIKAETLFEFCKFFVMVMAEGFFLVCKFTSRLVKV